MFKSLLIPAFCLLSLVVSAQKKAITEDGEEVILYSQGTWEYLNKSDKSEVPTPTNPTVFKKDEKSTFLLKSKKLKVGFWLNPAKWTIKPTTESDVTEYSGQFKDGDLYVMMITERVEIPLEGFKSIALNNAKEAAPDAKVVKEEYRNVNGLKVLMLQINGTIENIKFSYLGYYYSDENGSVQFITYTSQNLLPKLQKDCELLLNGLVEVK